MLALMDIHGEIVRMGAKLLPAFLYLLLLGLAGCEKAADKTSPSS
jgi:hypothetical protein